MYKSHLISPLAIAAVLPLCAAVQEHVTPPAANAYAEPPLELELAIGDEVVRCRVGAPAALADGTQVRVDVLPHRTFRADGAFEFDYPRGWRHSGAGGPEAGWWTLQGEGALVHVQKHREEAAEVAQKYADALSANDGRQRREVSREFDGRTLFGEAVDSPAHSIGGRSPYAHWVQEIYGVPGADGGAWLIVLQHGVPRPGAMSLASSERITIELEGEEHVVTIPGSGVDVGEVQRAALDSIVASWRWQE